MAYTANLGGNQQLMIVNQGTQTLITLFSSSSGQQQSQSSSVATGIWTRPPQLYKTASGFILQINGESASQYISIQANGINAVSNPMLNNAVQVNLENSPETTANPNPNKIEFEPMQPMQMGNMSMEMNPMSMRMGNMSMNMGETPKETSTKRFCSQCGEKIKPSDRFCSICGNKLDN